MKSLAVILLSVMFLVGVIFAQPLIKPVAGSKGNVETTTQGAKSVSSPN